MVTLSLILAIIAVAVVALVVAITTPVFLTVMGSVVIATIMIQLCDVIMAIFIITSLIKLIIKKKKTKKN